MNLDVRGEVCPYPMMKAVEAMKKVKGKDEVVVITDHAPCLEYAGIGGGRLQHGGGLAFSTGRGFLAGGLRVPVADRFPEPTPSRSPSTAAHRLAASR